MTKIRGTSTRKLTRRRLLAVAKKAGLTIRNKGGHIIVKLPDKGGIVVFSPGSRSGERHLDDQMRAFRRAGLL